MLKLYNDQGKYTLPEFAAISGIPREILLQMEISLLLNVMQGTLLIKPGELLQYKDRISNSAF